MEALTTIKNLLRDKKIEVPTYQRAYSWDTPGEESERKTQTDVFLADLEEYYKSNAGNPYYFGHLIFEEKDKVYYVIDGQQRLATIVIFLSTLFAKLKTIRKLSEEEEECFEDMIKRRSNYRFATVDYDNQFFIDYVIDKTKKDRNGLDTVSAIRIADAYDYFTKQLSDKNEDYLEKILKIISNSSCTTHRVNNESEAIQMFIFQNNRGKNPTNLEIIKAQFMYNVHLYGGEEKDNLIYEIKNRFETIYKAISRIEYKIDEDDVLLYTLRVYFDSLLETNALDKINKHLSEKPIPFIKAFTQSLATSFEHLTRFLGKDERDNMSIHSLVTLRGIGIASPFILKAYKFGLGIHEIGRLCESLEILVLRHRLIGTRAKMAVRVNDVFMKFTENNKEIQPIIEKIEFIKTTTDWWSAYWNDDELEKSIQGPINHSVAKYLLWKYEIYLESQGNAGYTPTRFDRVDGPELEHIAPTTEPEKKPHGYGEYDEEFKSKYIDCLGNYLLLSKSHNCTVGNVRFANKWKTYTHSEPQREIQKMIPENGPWDKEIIQKRKEKIIKFILSSC